LIDLQRRLVEVGRIRMGEKGPKGEPRRLEKWRLTSSDLERLQAAADLYGGKPVAWDAQPGQYELYTDTDQLPIMLLPGQTLSQWYELWSGGGAQRRCDGKREVLTDSECICAGEEGERKCKPTTRLNVLLPDVPGLGCWRLESHGWNAAVELAGTAQFLEQASARGQMLPARLRIEHRRQVKDGQTRHYNVPIIDIDVPLRTALAAANGVPEAQLEVAEARRLAAVPSTVAAIVAEVEKPAPAPKMTSRSAPPIPEDDVEFDEAPIEVEGSPPSLTSPSTAEADTSEQAGLPSPATGQASTASEPAPAPAEVIYANERQRRLLFATATEHGVDHDELKKIVDEVTGQDSTAKIPKSEFTAVLNVVMARQP
jgi:recombination directionality factor gp3-like protein